MKKRMDIIITPHMGEMARLLSCDTGMIAENRLIAAEKYAEQKYAHLSRIASFEDAT